MLAVFLLLPPSLAHAQRWVDTQIPGSSRFNDVYFVSPDTGWAVNGSAYIYATADAGEHWAMQLYQDDSHFRSVGFLNAHRGFVGNVGPDEFGATDPTPLYETFDSGKTWSPVAIFHGQAPKGLCGMHVVNDSTVVAVGRVRGPAFYVRTTDSGGTWTSKNMAEYAAGLIDVYFPDPDTGFAVGLTNQEHELSSCVVLATTDGGETWEERSVSSRTGEWCWKMSWPSRQTGYASIQRNNGGPIYFLKTADGGQTWEEKLFMESHYFVQGIGFVDENTGWIGGNSTQPAYMTTDGGETWAAHEIGIRLNRFRFLSDTLGYASGGSVFRYTTSPSTTVETPEAADRRLEPAFPNPFSTQTELSYALDSPDNVSIDVYDALGRLVRSTGAGVQPAGTYQITWDGLDVQGRTVAAGTYFFVVRIGSTTQTRPVVFIR